MAVVFAGLTMANVIGVPLMTLVGQHSSWRICYLLVGAIELVAAGCVAAVVPVDRHDAEGTAPGLRHELRAFRQPQIWLSLAIAMIGGAGLFASFSYIAPMMTHVAGFSSGGDHAVAGPVRAGHDRRQPRRRTARRSGADANGLRGVGGRDPGRAQASSSACTTSSPRR